MANLKYYIKEVTGGQLLNRKERAIFLWWSLSLLHTDTRRINPSPHHRSRKLRNLIKIPRKNTHLQISSTR